MVTSEQKSFLHLHGYRVGSTCRQNDGYAVEYPRVRADAFCKRYSTTVFASADAAWDHAWTDATRSSAIVAKWYQRLAQLASDSVDETLIPGDEFICQPA